MSIRPRIYLRILRIHPVGTTWSATAVQWGGRSNRSVNKGPGRVAIDVGARPPGDLGPGGRRHRLQAHDVAGPGDSEKLRGHQGSTPQFRRLVITGRTV